MKNKTRYFLFFALLIVIVSCSKEDKNDRFELLTGTIWVSDSLLVDGQDASGPGEILEKFKGEVKFNRDATGYFGQYTGSWRFAEDRTAIIITTDSLPIPLSTWIEELTEKSLKINTAYPSLTNPEEDMDIRMTFKAK
ncbi:MAG: hypothetical protein KG029_00050 [Bacteroidetes bacterium]|jgi:hypothetical protein|nr:hypothetical protein [Bacteroidota bacterium]